MGLSFFRILGLFGSAVGFAMEGPPFHFVGAMVVYRGHLQ